MWVLSQGKADLEKAAEFEVYKQIDFKIQIYRYASLPPVCRRSSHSVRALGAHTAEGLSNGTPKHGYDFTEEIKFWKETKKPVSLRLTAAAVGIEGDSRRLLFCLLIPHHTPLGQRSSFSNQLTLLPRTPETLEPSSRPGNSISTPVTLFATTKICSHVQHLPVHTITPHIICLHSNPSLVSNRENQHFRSPTLPIRQGQTLKNGTFMFGLRSCSRLVRMLLLIRSESVIFPLDRIPQPPRRTQPTFSQSVQL